MAQQFIGLHMWVSLRTGQQMKGTVSEVVTGQGLTLINGTLAPVTRFLSDCGL